VREDLPANHAAVETDQPGVAAPKLLNDLAGSDRNDLAVLDRNRLCLAASRVDLIDPPGMQDQISFHRAGTLLA
jgi:hypothetical protein